jgi:MFS family permease
MIDAAVFKPSWPGLLSLLLCAVLPTVAMFTVGLALPQIAAAFANDPNALLLAQLAAGATGLAFAIGSPIAGGLVERFGVRAVFVVSLIAYVVLGVLPAVLNDLYLIMAARFLFGFAVAGATTAGMTGLAQLPLDVRGKMFGRNAFLSIAGALVTFPIAGVLANIDWHLVFMINFIALPMLPLALMLPRTKPVAAEDEVAAAGLFGGAPVSIVLLSGFVGLCMCLGPLFSAFYLASIDVNDTQLVSIPLTAKPAAGLIVTSV